MDGSGDKTVSTLECPTFKDFSKLKETPSSPFTLGLLTAEMLEGLPASRFYPGCSHGTSPVGAYSDLSLNHPFKRCLDKITPLPVVCHWIENIRIDAFRPTLKFGEFFEKMKGPDELIKTFDAKSDNTKIVTCLESLGDESYFVYGQKNGSIGFINYMPTANPKEYVYDVRCLLDVKRPVIAVSSQKRDCALIAVISYNTTTRIYFCEVFDVADSSIWPTNRRVWGFKTKEHLLAVDFSGYDNPYFLLVTSIYDIRVFDIRYENNHAPLTLTVDTPLHRIATRNSPDNRFVGTDREDVLMYDIRRFRAPIQIFPRIDKVDSVFWDHKERNLVLQSVATLDLLIPLNHYSRCWNADMEAEMMHKDFFSVPPSYRYCYASDVYDKNIDANSIQVRKIFFPTKNAIRSTDDCWARERTFAIDELENMDQRFTFCQNRIFTPEYIVLKSNEALKNPMSYVYAEKDDTLIDLEKKMLENDFNLACLGVTTWPEFAESDWDLSSDEEVIAANPKEKKQNKKKKLSKKARKAALSQHKQTMTREEKAKEAKYFREARRLTEDERGVFNGMKIEEPAEFPGDDYQVLEIIEIMKQRSYYRTVVLFAHDAKSVYQIHPLRRLLLKDTQAFKKFFMAHPEHKVLAEIVKMAKGGRFRNNWTLPDDILTCCKYVSPADYLTV